MAQSMPSVGLTSLPVAGRSKAALPLLAKAAYAGDERTAGNAIPYRTGAAD